MKYIANIIAWWKKCMVLKSDEESQTERQGSNECSGHFSARSENLPSDAEKRVVWGDLSIIEDKMAKPRE